MVLCTAPELVIVGNGMVGQKLVDELVRDGAHRQWRITVIGDEAVPAYDRVALSTWFDGASADELSLCDIERMQAAGVVYLLGERVEQIDLDGRAITTDHGQLINYNHLVLATGSRPFVPPIAGNEAAGCFVYRTLEDLEQIRGWSDGKKRGVVVGGGLLGLEAANALLNLGLETHVVEMADRLMPQQLDEQAASMLQRWVDELGITTHLSFMTESIAVSAAGQCAGLQTADGDLLEADMVVFSAGIRPRDELARASGLAVGERGGVVVDDRLLTSNEHVSAIGEVACHDGKVYGLVAPGYEMARVLAQRLAGGEAAFEGGDLSTKLKLLGVDLATFGSADPADDRIEFSDPIAQVYRRISLSEGKVTGGVLVGDVSGYEILHAMALGSVASRDVGALVSPALATGTIDIELPDTAQICSCNNVCRGAIKEAVAAGHHDLAALKVATEAGTGCGGCLPGIQTMLLEGLESLGVEIDRGLCEHFAYSRQELFDLIRVNRHRSWSSVVEAHGSGRGCAICRPVVGSILASLSNGYILDGDQAALQDTNDHALANMQRNGTYSVVPRVPAGEITPAQLIALGEIAQDFDLYTKITGGQRVDLFGAQLHELPQIWQRVVDAGMESGHAYGKALRTVKSCVGSMWCRYGVQDSVSMAIQIELRYRGLRAPHKLKSAVSGCTRECAEAQSKDFGVIATEGGWNLYVCGNGGRVPRHADLFATDLTDDELIRYLDRFLMFYIRTADRLERTSTWFERLEGGLDYLRSVVIDDALGICAELEGDMAEHVNDYACEWAETLKNPDRLAKYVEFVNVPEVHSTPVWITERGQRVPEPARI